MESFSTSMMMGERIFGFLETVQPYEKDRAPMSIILWSRNQQHEAEGQGHLVDAIFKKNVHVPSLPTPNSNIILWIPQNLLLDLSGIRDLTNLSTKKMRWDSFFQYVLIYIYIYIYICIYSSPNMDISKHPTAFEHVKSSGFKHVLATTSFSSSGIQRSNLEEFRLHTALLAIGLMGVHHPRNLKMVICNPGGDDVQHKEGVSWGHPPKSSSQKSCQKLTPFKEKQPKGPGEVDP